MNNGKKFSTALFGYNKRDVYEYVEKLAQDLETQIREKNTDYDFLKSENEQLKIQNEDLKTRLNEIETNRDYIANAIIKAEEQANLILENARRETERKKAIFDREMEAEAEKYNKLCDEVSGLRQSILSVNKKYELELVKLTLDKKEIEVLSNENFDYLSLDKSDEKKAENNSEAKEGQE